MNSTECNQFAVGSQRYSICTGSPECGLTLEKINKYRARWNLPPLDKGGTEPINTVTESTREHLVRLPASTPASTVARVRKSRPSHKRPGLGDIVGMGLTKFGVTEERVTKWLGRPCGCGRRKKKLNALGEWVIRAMSLSQEEAEQELEELIG